MKQLIVFILVMHGILIIIEKYSIIEKIKHWSMNKGLKVLFESMECIFCRSHHFAVVGIIVYIMINGFSIGLLLWPLCFASFETIVKK